MRGPPPADKSHCLAQTVAFYVPGQTGETIGKINTEKQKEA